MHDHWGEAAELNETLLSRITLEMMSDEDCNCRQKVTLYMQTSIFCHIQGLRSVASTCAFRDKTGCSLHGTGKSSSRSVLMEGGHGKADGEEGDLGAPSPQLEEGIVGARG